MKVKELIEKLQSQDPEKDVYIQQGEDPEYMKTNTVRETELQSTDHENDAEYSVVVIEFE